MKQCPQCKTTYSDASLRFCLTDGTALMAVADEQPTVVSDRRGKVRVDIPNDEPESRMRPAGPSRGPSRRWVKVLAGIFLLGALIIAAAVAAGLYFYFSLCCGPANSALPSPTPVASPSATPDTEKAKLQEELANLQKKLEEQKNANVRQFPSRDEHSLPTARVNSPNDGFLALRGEPDPEYGERIAKIPHGAVVELSKLREIEGDDRRANRPLVFGHL